MKCWCCGEVADYCNGLCQGCYQADEAAADYAYERLLEERLFEWVA